MMKDSRTCRSGTLTHCVVRAACSNDGCGVDLNGLQSSLVHVVVCVMQKRRIKGFRRARGSNCGIQKRVRCVSAFGRLSVTSSMIGTS